MCCLFKSNKNTHKNTIAWTYGCIWVASFTYIGGFCGKNISIGNFRGLFQRGIFSAEKSFFFCFSSAATFTRCIKSDSLQKKKKKKILLLRSIKSTF